MKKAKRINETELKQMIGNLLDQRDSKYALLLYTAALTGLRVSDLIKVTWNDLLSKEQLFKVQEDKTGKIRTVNVPNDLFKFAQSVYPGCDKQNLVFYSRNDNSKPLSRQAIDNRIKGLGRHLFNQDYSMHSFRKYFAYKVLEMAPNRHIGLEIVRKIFMHYSIAVTAEYLGIDDLDQREAVMELNFNLN